jgi:hypothetical protein
MNLFIVIILYGISNEVVTTKLFIDILEIYKYIVQNGMLSIIGGLVLKNYL